MKTKKICIFPCVFVILLFFSLNGCNATKEMQQRRNLMMPHKSDLPMNSKYKEPTKRKKNKVKVKKWKPGKKKF